MNTTAKNLVAATSMLDGGLIVFGRDEAGKAHASWFDEANAGPARAAAAEMGFFALQVIGDGLSAISATLPAGRLFASGRAFVPFVKGALLDQLVEHLPEGTVIPAPTLRLVASGGTSEAAAGDAKRTGGEKYDLPTDWTGIKAGTLVLATEGHGEGWFECVVLDAKPQDVFQVKWRDFPDFAPFYRHRSALALIYPHSKVQ